VNTIFLLEKTRSALSSRKIGLKMSEGFLLLKNTFSPKHRFKNW